MKCLIVDDDPTCIHLMEMHLSTYAECDTAENGKLAVEAFSAAIEANNPYDLITLDVMMPEMDGHETLKAINKIQDELGIKDSDRVKIILTTIRNDSRTIMGALNEGCVSYILKPVDEFKILNIIKEIGLINSQV